MPKIGLAVIGLVTAMSLAGAADWPMAGRDASRDAVSPEKAPPTTWQVDLQAQDGTVSKKARNIKWSARLGTRSLGGPVIADELVWVGTNNQNPRDPKRKGDASVLMCFRESDGQFLWQYVSPRLEKAFSEDYYQHSMATPLVQGDRLWLITNRCTALCLDISPLRKGEGTPREVWHVDMRKEFGVVPNSAMMADGFGPSMAMFENWVYAVTSNGVDEDHLTLRAPEAIGGRGKRNYVMATPVYAEGRVYIATGRDPEQFIGEGCLYCIAPTRQGDISLDVELAPGKVKANPNSGVIWHTPRGLTEEQAQEWGRDYAFCRTISACVVADGLLYAADLDGFFHCFDAASGKLHWRHDFKAIPWGAPLWVDGKVYLATDDGDVLIFEHGKKKSQLPRIEMETSIRTAPVFANGVLYVATESRLYAIQEKK